MEKQDIDEEMTVTRINDTLVAAKKNLQKEVINKTNELLIQRKRKPSDVSLNDKEFAVNLSNIKAGIHY